MLKKLKYNKIYSRFNNVFFVRLEISSNPSFYLYKNKTSVIKAIGLQFIYNLCLFKFFYFVIETNYISCRIIKINFFSNNLNVHQCRILSIGTLDYQFVNKQLMVFVDKIQQLLFLIIIGYQQNLNNYIYHFIVV